MEESTRSDLDIEMMMLTLDDVVGQNPDPSDEVENLQNSYREAVNDDSIQPKMQCLMMDSSFSMVTMQGEDSGIAWETTPGGCCMSWLSEATDVSPVPIQVTTSGSRSAGKIIFVLDDEMLSKQRKTKEKESSQKSKAEKQLVFLAESSENFSGRPELVEVSKPNVKFEGEEDREGATCPLADNEQCLFSIVSEGSEILNIVVPPKLATVDEEESKEMVDNLSYLEDSLALKANEETQDNEMLIPTDSEVKANDQFKPPHCACLGAMDPPGAPVARPTGRGAVRNMDYFEAFSLIDAQAPGSPAVIANHQEHQEAEATTKKQNTESSEQSENYTITKSVDNDKLDTVSLEELTSELLDEVFYGGTDSYPVKSLDDEVGGAEGAKYRLPSKSSGSTLFSSQEDILTPVFLPEGPPKIIDPVLLEEPKAMAFLYTDLYEEALGTRRKDEDTESMTSEKSFHSRHSDREAQGYLEKYALIDETPAEEVKQPGKDRFPEEDERILPQDLLDFEESLLESEKELRVSEEVTDFFRSSASSSPCELDPFPRSLEDDDKQTMKETTTQKRVSVAAAKVTEPPVDLMDPASSELTSAEPDWDWLESHDDLITDLHSGGQDESRVSKDEEVLKQDSDTNRPAAPPGGKAASSTKGCLDLTPLTPADGTPQDKEEGGGKEHRVEEKETASPVETADEGDGDEEENMQNISEAAQMEITLAELTGGSSKRKRVKDDHETSVQDVGPAEEEGAGRDENEGAPEQTELEETDVQADVETETTPERREDSSTIPSAKAATNKRQCAIL
ncbi:cardiomyopathy-associated protein 5 [Nematolebias whitei]|uniref:cardiomyopathy-associated protein 5 n=1 Tax=Nematolebias whitei TaxID=451745 RepID=UPI00189AF5D4|nr:cardiomyopathy-associated protein 5 [Nematolebias whitei]